jgi:hypothetical protein
MVVWERIIDFAEIATAVSAVAAVVLAAWLGLKAIRIAKSDNGQAQQVFLYGQVDSVLQSALALTSAANDLANVPDVHADSARRTLQRCAEELEGRIRVLTALKLIPAGSGNAEDVQQFAAALVIIALARQELLRDGRHVLVPTVFDGEDEVTGELLGQLAMQVHGHRSYKEEGHTIEAFDGQGMSTAFDSAPAVAVKLRSDLVRVDWDPTMNQSLRVVMPWVRAKLGWLYVQRDLEGALQCLTDTRHDGDYFDHEKATMVELPRPQQVIEDWIDQWPAWSSSDIGEFLPPLSPEHLVEQVLHDMRIELLDRLIALVAGLRAGLPDPG